jgi:hypothetical protein
MKSMLVMVSLAAIAATLPAQSVDDALAASALRHTDIGALAPLVSPAMSERRLNGAQMGLRYALVDEHNVRTNSYAVSALFAPNLESSVSITAGITDDDCNGCDASVLLGLGGDMRVYEGGDLATGSALTIGVSGDVGFAQIRTTDQRALALGVGVPITLSYATGGRDGLHVSPYFTPVFGVGQIAGSCSITNPVPTSCATGSGTRFLLGGGVGVWNPTSNLSASIGVNQVIITGAQPVFGINVVLGGR